MISNDVTIDDITKRIALMEKEIRKIHLATGNALQTLCELDASYKHYRVSHGEYNSMEKLTEFKGRELKAITIIYETKKGNIDFHRFERNENTRIFEIDSQGHIRYAAMLWNSGQYFHWYYEDVYLHQNDSYSAGLHCIGYMDIEFEEGGK